MAIWQDLVSEYGFASSYQSVQRFVCKRRGTQTPEARVVIVTAAGQEAQVDYGTGPMVRDPESRKYRRTRLFVMTLGCSRKSVRLLTFRSSSRIWAEFAMCSRTTARWPCRAAFKIPIAKAKSNPALVMRKRHR
jgi:transposase